MSVWGCGCGLGVGVWGCVCVCVGVWVCVCMCVHVSGFVLEMCMEALRGERVWIDSEVLRN